MFGWLVSDDITQWQLFWYVMQIHLQITCATNYFSSSKVNDTPYTTMSFHHATSGYHATKACTYTSGYLIYRTKNYLVSLLISNQDHADRFGFFCYCWFCNNIKGDYNHKTFFMKMIPNPRQSVGTRQLKHVSTYVPVGTSYVEREKPTYISMYVHMLPF